MGDCRLARVNRDGNTARVKLEDAPIDSQHVLGVTLVLSLLALLLAVPVAILACGAAARIVKRMSRRRKPNDRRARREGWAQAGDRATTPTAAELELQHGEGKKSSHDTTDDDDDKHLGGDR